MKNRKIKKNSTTQPAGSEKIQRNPDTSNINKNRLIKEKRVCSGTEGFEPPNSGTKTRCLTTWPRPILISKKNNICIDSLSTPR